MIFVTKSTKTKRSKKPPGSYWVIGVEDAKKLARDARCDPPSLLTASQASLSCVQIEIRVGEAQRCLSYYQGGTQALTFAVQRREQASGPTRFMRWEGGFRNRDLEELRDERCPGHRTP